MRVPIALALALAALGAVLGPPPPAGAGPDEHDAAGLFRGRCANCHTIPDPELRTDRAWLDQVHRTA